MIEDSTAMSDLEMETGQEEGEVTLDFNSGTLEDNTFMKIQTVLDTFNSAHSVLSEVPAGKKDGMFFIISYDPNGKKKIKDDCGEWTRPSCPKAFFMKKGASVINLFLKNGMYCVEKHIQKTKMAVPLEPQPNENEILEVMRRYENIKIPHSRDVLKRRITWFLKIPANMDFLSYNEALVEYTGVYPPVTPVTSTSQYYTRDFSDMTSEMIEDTDEYRVAVKMVLKRQMRDIILQLSEQGEDLAVLQVNSRDGTSSAYGTVHGEWFLEEQAAMLKQFRSFCKINANKKRPSMAKGLVSKTFKSGIKRPEVIVHDTPTVKFTIPKSVCEGFTEEEVCAVVGRVIASQTAENKDKGDGSSGGFKFDSLVELLNLKPKDSPVRSTRSGRRVTNKYLDSIRSSAKKCKTIKSESEEETEPDERSVLIQLSEIDPAVLTRVHLTIGETQVHLEETTLPCNDKMVILASTLVKDVYESGAKSMGNKKQVKVVVVLTEEEGEFQIKVEVSGGLTKRIKSEYVEMDDSDTEHLDFLDGVMDEEEDVDDDDFDYTQDFDDDSDGERSNAVPLKPKPVRAVGTKGTPRMSGNHREDIKLVRKKKYEKPLSERMPMACEHCGQYVAGKSNLKSHIRRVHLKVKNHRCAICQKGFWSNNALESHMLSVHTRRCDSCQEYVVESVPWSTGVDMRMKRDVICTCGAIVSIFSSFGRRRQYLRDDEPDENGEIPTKAKSNTGTKYACGTCGKLFMKKSNCERHSRAHTDFKGIACDICGSTFTYENSLKRHLQTEHGIVKYACEVCGKNYSNDTALKVHYIKAHSQQNLNIGDNLVMIVKEKGTGADLEEQMEEIMEGEEDVPEEVIQIQNDGTIPQTERIVVTRRPDGSTEQHVVSGPQELVVSGGQELVISGSQELVVADESQLLAAQADIGHLEEGEVMVTQGEGGQVQVTTGDPELTQDSAQRIVQQAIQDGHMIAQDGNMSIIIKQLPLSQVSMS